MVLLEPVQHARREEKELITVTAHLESFYGSLLGCTLTCQTEIVSSRS
jgi:hypothetical protein